ncbi:hypothetical protein C4571_03860 [Candidatus Parcubacteria bacterium]|nr:MAG: hypothetical protein C4571_03860 [Candidatus Parcubacteria bacterium]
MHPSIKYLVPLVFVLIFIGLVFLLLKRPASIEVVTPEPAQSVLPISPPPQGPSPSVSITQKDKTTLGLRWENFPSGTEILRVFRSPVGKNRWLQWQSIPSAGGSGNAEIQIGSKEDLNNFSYYFQAASSGGDSLYTSPVAQPGGGSPGTSTSPGTPIGGFNLVMAASTSTEAPPQSGFNLAGTATGTAPPTTQFNLSNTSTQPTPTSTATSSEPAPIVLAFLPTSSVTIFMKGIYYSPLGIIPTGSGVQDADFWVLYINQFIEVGWQNISTSTNKIALYRSASQSGPWLKILEQTGVDPTQPDVVRFGDNSSGADHYYRMEALDGSTILQTYGPVLLPALGT